MKVGILTYHRSHNYGALLQAIALRHAIAKLGHDVYFLDYWPKYRKEMYEPINKMYLRRVSMCKKIKYLCTYPLKYIPVKKRFNKFQKFIERYVEPYCIPCSTKCDIIVCGSDQIWRKQSNLNNKLDPRYFAEGEFFTDEYISYAGSMGIIDLEEEDRANIKKWLSKFSYISVRENNLKLELEKMQIKPIITQVLDPTLLLESNDWQKLFSISNTVKKPYVLFYDLMSGSFEESLLRKFAKENNYDFKILSGAANGIKKNNDVEYYADPEGMIKLIANASFVFTSSFHGLVFSIIFKKNFYCAFNNNSDRAKSLLDVIGESNRLLSPMVDRIPPLTNIDYDKVFLKLNVERRLSQEFIHNLFGSNYVK